MTFNTVWGSTIFGKLGIVIICVAVFAGREIYRLRVPTLMAFLTIHNPMLSLQRIVSSIVIKSGFCL